MHISHILVAHEHIHYYYYYYYCVQNLTQEQRELVQDLFDWLVDPSLQFIQRKCKTFVNTSPMHLVQTLMQLYTTLMDEIISAINITPSDMDDQPNPNALTPQQVGFVGLLMAAVVDVCVSSFSILPFF